MGLFQSTTEPGKNHTCRWTLPGMTRGVVDDGTVPEHHRAWRESYL